MFCKKGVLKKFAKLTEKHLLQSLSFNKVAEVAGLRPVTLLKKEALTQVFSYEFCVIFTNTYYIEKLRWQILKHTVLESC